jgi:hypothetical protein
MNPLVFLIIAAGSTADCNKNGIPDEEDVRPTLFSAPIFTPIEEHLSSAATGDLDGDGDLDLAGWAWGPGRIEVHLNDGTARFVAAEPVAAWSYLRDVALADMDGDQKLDMVAVGIASESRGELGIARNLGDAAFEALRVVPAPRSPQEIVAADLDADGDADVAVAHVAEEGSPGGVSIFLNQGGGELAEPFLLEAPSPEWLLGLDLDGDGDLDLAALSWSHEISLFWNRGDASFEPRVPLSANFRPASLAAADFDGDSSVDLAVAEGESAAAGALSILLNDGSGGFHQHGPDRYFYPPAQSIIAGDFDGDGSVDIAASVGPSLVLLNDGAARFSLASVPSLGLVGQAAGDFDADGAVDLAGPTVEIGQKGLIFGLVVLCQDALPPASPDSNGNEIPDECETFRRGDVDGDGEWSLGDPIHILSFLFLGSPRYLACERSADSNDSGAIDISDAAYLLDWLFMGGPPVHAPTECGIDATPDSLACDDSPECR